MTTIRKNWGKIDTGKFLQRHLDDLMNNKEIILKTSELYYIDIPYFTVLDDSHDFYFGLYLGTLLDLWEQDQFITDCPVCNNHTLLGYFYRMQHYYRKTDLEHNRSLKSAEFYGICSSCKNLIVYELENEERYCTPSFRMSYSLIKQKKLDKARHQASSVSPFELMKKLEPQKSDSEATASLSDPIVIRNITNLSDEEKLERKIKFYRSFVRRRMTWIQHLSYSHRPKEELEAYIQEHIREVIEK